jgi:hypothetical protein
VKQRLPSSRHDPCGMTRESCYPPLIDTISGQMASGLIGRSPVMPMVMLVSIRFSDYASLCGGHPVRDGLCLSVLSIRPGVAHFASERKRIFHPTALPRYSVMPTTQSWRIGITTERSGFPFRASTERRYRAIAHGSRGASRGQPRLRGPGSPGAVAHPVSPQIRTCPSKASGSSRCGAVHHTIHQLTATRR